MDKIVIKVGGSLLYTNDLKLNYAFLAKLKKFLESRSIYKKCVIFVGGGRLSRYMADLVSEKFEVIDGKKHLMGIESTKYNAVLVSSIIDIKDTTVYNPDSLGKLTELLLEDSANIIISGGLKPGWSTDMDAAFAADILGVDRFIKLTNVDGIYSADPNTDENAYLLKELSWEQYFKQFSIVEGSKHIPNQHIPIDVTCAQFSKKKRISAYISGGKSLDSTDDISTIFYSGTSILA